MRNLNLIAAMTFLLLGCDDPSRAFISDYNHVIASHEINSKNAKEAATQIETFVKAPHPRQLLDKHALGMAILHAKLAALCRITGEKEKEALAAANAVSFYDKYMTSPEAPPQSAPAKIQWLNSTMEQKADYVRTEIIDKLEPQYRTVFPK